MTESELKDFLDTFVEEHERNFVVVFSPRKTKRILGTYKPSRRRIRIYEKSLPEPINLIATGLHELGHHLAWERHGDELIDIWRKTKRRTSHGRIFKMTLDRLLETFNSRHAERFRGILVHDFDGVRFSPWFMKFYGGITSAEEMMTDYQATMKLYTAIFGRRRKKSSTANPAATPSTDSSDTNNAVEETLP
jgi:hypothetical protein